MSWLLLMTVGYAIAEDGNASQKVSPYFNQWVAYDQVSEFPVDADGTMAGQGEHLEARSIAGMSIQSDRLTLNAKFGGNSGQIWGETWTLTDVPDQRQRNQHSIDVLTPRCIDRVDRIHASMRQHWVPLFRFEIMEAYPVILNVLISAFGSDWNQTGNKLEPNCNQIGTELEPSRHQIATG